MSVRLTTHGGAMVVDPTFAGAPLVTTTRSDAAVGLAVPRPPAVGVFRASRPLFARVVLSTASTDGPAPARVAPFAPTVTPVLLTNVRLPASVVSIPDHGTSGSRFRVRPALYVRVAVAASNTLAGVVSPATLVGLSTPSRTTFPDST